VAERDNIEIELIKLASGARLLRFREPNSGLALERALDPNRPVADQRQELAEIFRATLAQAQSTLA
jgi:hypothetical protein